MGNFIDMAAVLAPKTRVKEYLATLEEDGAGESISKQADRTLVIFEESTADFDRVRQLSKALSTAAFALHIHDDDLWLYELYADGELVDRFNAQPHYWKKLSAADAALWKGNPGAVVAHWRGISVEQIDRYLRSREEAQAAGTGKAYSADQFDAGDCWQVCDFLQKLGTPYPDEPPLL